MTKFYKQEVNTFEESKYYYRMKTKGRLNLNDIAEQIAFPGSGISKGTVINVIYTFINEIALSLGKGYNINIEGLGTFKVKLEMSENKLLRVTNGDDKECNAASIMIGDIHFRADKGLIEKTNRNCRLTKGGTNRITQSPYSKEERLQLALSFLGNPENLYMNTNDYMRMTKLSKAKALKELFEFRNNKDSGITFIGKGNRKVYVLSSLFKTSG